MEYMKLMAPKEAHYTVYKLEDPEGKVYIGFTGRPVKERWDSGWGYHEKTTVRKAIDFYGWKNIRREILCGQLTRSGAVKLEKWFIEYYDSMNPEKGYNQLTGGEHRGCRASDALKKRISDARVHTCMTNDQYNLWNQKRMQEFYRSHPERRTEISRTMSAYLLSPEGRAFPLSSNKAKPVRCVETGQVYPSQRAAETETGLCSIHKVCRGRRKVCGGYHWEYV